MKTYKFIGEKIAENVKKADFTIQEINGSYTVSGNMEAAKKVFRSIHRMPPNEYGNFFGRENAGFSACKELIKNGVAGYKIETE